MAQCWLWVAAIGVGSYKPSETRQITSCKNDAEIECGLRFPPVVFICSARSGVISASFLKILFVETLNQNSKERKNKSMPVDTVFHLAAQPVISEKLCPGHQRPRDKMWNIRLLNIVHAPIYNNLVVI